MTRPIAERREEYIHLQLPNLPPITYVLPLEDAVAVRDALQAALAQPEASANVIEFDKYQPSPSAGEVLVDGNLIRQVIRALMGYGSTLHVQAAASPHPGVQAVQKLECALRDALAAPQPTPEREALVLHTALHREQVALNVLVDVWEQYATTGRDGSRSDAGMSALAGVESLLHAAGRIDDEGRVLTAPTAGAEQ